MIIRLIKITTINYTPLIIFSDKLTFREKENGTSPPRPSTLSIQTQQDYNNSRSPLKVILIIFLIHYWHYKILQFLF